MQMCRLLCTRVTGQWSKSQAASSATIEGGKERRGSCVVAEGLAEVGEAIDIPRAEDEAAAKLK